jgi:hypothetical protein
VKKQNVKTRMQGILDNLNYQFEDFTVDGFVEWVEQQRERPIVFLPQALPSPIFGAWVKGHDRDVIVFETDTSAIHQTHIKLHEMAHMLCDHPTVELEEEEIQILFRGANVDLELQPLLLRSQHSDENEREAEMLTSLIQKRVLRHDRFQGLVKVMPVDDRFAAYIEAMDIESMSLS